MAFGVDRGPGPGRGMSSMGRIKCHFDLISSLKLEYLQPIGEKGECAPLLRSRVDSPLRAPNPGGGEASMWTIGLPEARGIAAVIPGRTVATGLRMNA